MGVRGLTTYLRENQRALSKSHLFPSPSPQPTPLVVDGWSFIYELLRTSHLPWVYGGEYQEIVKLVTKSVKAWITLGLKLYFVFDGAYPSLKLPTVLDRILQQVIQPQLLFFRTSPSSRATPRFLNETRLMPPLFYTACLHALYAISQSSPDTLEIHFADEEADPYAVELAGRVGGYVSGNDSDFVILNSDGYLGYIPFAEMVWTSKEERETDVPHDDDDDDDFQIVTKAKKKNPPDQAVSRGVIPPDNFTTLSLLSFSPIRLASHLNLPVSLLPLLGSFVGNDFSKQSSSFRDLQKLFFNRRLTLCERINHVAATLHSTLASFSPKRKQRQRQATSVIDLIDKTVHTLLAPVIHTLGSGEVKTVTDSIVESTLQYAIPKFEGKDPQLWPTEVCPLHEPDECPLLPFFSRLLVAERSAGERSEKIVQRNKIRQLYIWAYRQGKFSPEIIDVLSTGCYWSTFFLEHPDLKTTAVTIGSPLRLWGYAILEDAVGLPDAKVEGEDRMKPRGELEPQGESEDGESEELVDVAEEDSDEDLLAPLRGELRRLHDPGDEPATEPGLSSSHSVLSQRSGPKTITEYVRRGSRVATCAVSVPALADLLGSVPDWDATSPVPLQLRPKDARLAVLLHAAKSDTLSIRALPHEQLMVALAVRWVVQAAHLQAEESKAKETERWTKNEAQCVLASFSWPGTRTQEAVPDTPQDTLPPIEERNIQLMSQVLTALESLEHLSQILLIPDRVPLMAHRLSGRTCHSYWTGVTSLRTEDIPHGLWDACVDGLEEGVFTVKWGKGKKSKRRRRNEAVVPHASNEAGVVHTGLFGLLGDTEI